MWGDPVPPRDHSGEHAAPAPQRGRPGHPAAEETGLAIALFGAISLLRNGRPVEVRSRKAQALLGYLALEATSRPVSRERLCGLLWSESPEDKARASLRQVLHELKLALDSNEPELLHAGRAAITLSGRCTTDINEILARLEAREIDSRLLDRKVIASSLLPGCEDLDPSFRAWLMTQRQLLEEQLTRGLERLLKEPGETSERARQAAAALLNLDPTNEEACRHLMRDSAARGDAAGALRIYRRLWELLEQEYDAEPSSQTQTLAVELKTCSQPARVAQAQPTLRIEPPLPFAPLAPLRLDDRPSIAVLPFRKNASEPGEAYFADGIIEGIVHVLAGIERIAVVSRGSALVVAETTVDPREAGQRLGVRYVLYGGVRRSGERLRVTTELVDADSGTVVRSNRHDGAVSELFELQDRVAEQIVTTLAPQVRQRELARALRKPARSLSAYDLVLRGLDRLHRLDQTSFIEARRLLERAIEHDPTFAPAYSYLAWWHVFGIAQGWSKKFGLSTEASGSAAATALELDPDDALALTLRGNALGYAKTDYDLATRMLDQAVVNSPSCALAWSIGAALRCWLEDGTEAVRWAERGVRLAPSDPFSFLFEHLLSQAHDTAADHESALHWSRRSIVLNPQHVPAWRVLAVSLAALSRLGEAREAASRILALEPDFRVRPWAARTPLQGATRIRFAERLLRAGLPE